jgi:RNA polymerase sigma factor (sigma-70 family)
MSEHRRRPAIYAGHRGEDALGDAKSDEAVEWNRSLHDFYRQELFRFFRKKVGSHHDAEDLTQDTLVRLINRPPKIKSRSSDAYIFTVALNLFRDHSRKLRVRFLEKQGPNASEDFFLSTFASEEPSPEHVLIGKSEVEIVVGALNELTERTRSIFILCRVEGMPQREIAAKLGISISAVEKHVSKALHHIHDRLDP